MATNDFGQLAVGGFTLCAVYTDLSNCTAVLYL